MGRIRTRYLENSFIEARILRLQFYFMGKGLHLGTGKVAEKQTLKYGWTPIFFTYDSFDF